ncbi:DUF3301 domain-containing protein [Caedibacter taeniospiralis]|uniref:DUF3301 domain-containing protein n=1 Tax=Caedibacter taeniospiralis TaxID=28907 RepID=UPI000C273D79|nr:DUF3301 domain-containing protein [Caedibacter taeniospiralis]
MSIGIAVAMIIVVVVILGWRSAMRAREFAIHTALKVVKQWDVQLLDDTVCLTKIRLSRQSDIGSMCLFREYAFEYSDDGVDRYRAFLQFNGNHFLQVISNEQKVTVTEVGTKNLSTHANNVIDLNHYRTQQKNDLDKDKGHDE